VTLSGGDSPLPGLNYTWPQLFAISYAHSFCNRHRAATTQNILFNGQTPNNDRVNGVMQNSKVFTDLFKCSTNTPCVLYGAK
jgi:hypothetical protein